MFGIQQKKSIAPIAAFLLTFSGLAVVSTTLVAEEEEVFSGPQVGEKMLSLKVTGVYEDAGKERDVIADGAGKPTMLIFMHKLTRPSASLTRVLSDYAAGRAKDGLQCSVVWLSEDRSKAEEYLKRAKQSLKLKVPVGISVDGQEGPGSYGLNRNVSLTILIGKDNRVSANYALIQPSVTEAPKILADVVKLIGGKPPTMEELAPPRYRRPAMKPKPGDPRPLDPKLAELLRSMINKEASAEEVKKAAQAVEAYVANNRANQTRIGTITNRIISAGKLENYGTKPAQEQLQAWAKKYPAEKPSTDRPSASKRPEAPKRPERSPSKKPEPKP